MFHRPTSTNDQPAPTTRGAQEESKAMSQTPESGESQADRSVDIPASPFQRPGQPAAATATAPAAAAPVQRAVPPAYGGYPAVYGSTPVGASSSASAVVDPKSRRLVIGQGITMSGEIESCDLLVVEGTVEAALKGASILEISESGMFYGTVEINEATIAGKFEGDLTVNGRLTVRSSGSITGAIAYKELAVESGATIDGKITPLGGKGASSEKKSHKGSSEFPLKEPKAQIAPEDDDLPILQRAAAR
jgi:cytoskeletal protein CcmA (bactofilin family)